MMTENERTRILYSLRDFQLSLSALDFYLDVDVNEKYDKIQLRKFRCYIDEAVISYCRPFTRSKGLPLFKFSDVGIVPTDQENFLHKTILEYRHQVVAHSDIDKMRFRLKSKPIKIGDDFLNFLTL